MPLPWNFRQTFRQSNHTDNFTKSANDSLIHSFFSSLMMQGSVIYKRHVIANSPVMEYDELVHTAVISIHPEGAFASARSAPWLMLGRTIFGSLLWWCCLGYTLNFSNKQGFQKPTHKCHELVKNSEHQIPGYVVPSHSASILRQIRRATQ